MKKLVVMIDGGHLRALARLADRNYNPDFIEQFAIGCKTEDEELLRVLYYDCAPYNGTVELPISKQSKTYANPGTWLNQLAERDLFAVRVGQLKFRGFALASVPDQRSQLSDENFNPVFQQKGVDMRIGLDIATYSSARAVDRIALVIGDTDLIPALKHARKAGLQVILAKLPNHTIAPELRRHSDFVRPVGWP
jgi:uncharacterized LabA/DUF88 family protein